MSFSYSLSLLEQYKRTHGPNHILDEFEKEFKKENGMPFNFDFLISSESLKKLNNFLFGHFFTFHSVSLEIIQSQLDRIILILQWAAKQEKKKDINPIIIDLRIRKTYVAKLIENVSFLKNFYI